jgi:peptidoglycan hydrolase CwlO-like protein
MGFLSKAFGGGSDNGLLAAQQASQDKALAEQRAAVAAQKATTAEQEAKTAAAEKAQRAIRSGGRRGLLAYVPDDTTSTTLGG